jgi:hypothetical protein
VSYTASKKIVRAAARGAQSFAVVHDDLDLDIAQAHVDAAVEALLHDPPAFNRAVKAVALAPKDAGNDTIARAAVVAFFDLERRG